MKTETVYTLTASEMIAAFTQWDHEYRLWPEQFASTVEHLLRSTPETYGPVATACFISYLERLRAVREGLA